MATPTRTHHHRSPTLVEIEYSDNNPVTPERFITDPQPTLPLLIYYVGNSNKAQTFNVHVEAPSTTNERVPQCQTRSSTTRSRRQPTHEPVTPPDNSTDTAKYSSPPDSPNKYVRPRRNSQCLLAGTPTACYFNPLGTRTTRGNMVFCQRPHFTTREQEEQPLTMEARLSRIEALI
ncbi:hypothetical protein J1N35_029113 [Gossypium stocksii]|uniref:Uncharacterized protein n=1 Tax=Gossypium stocksii TaxID=47602 RepID=A0A9D3UX78_9ROSI|nr:hypothetical protein J1N35_029113 [Gossypium stocksii]